MSAQLSLPPDQQRELIAELHADAEYYRQLWRECSYQAGKLENELTAEQRHVRVKPTTDITKRPRRNYEVEVIQIAYELGDEFVTADVVDAGVPYPTALKWLKVWEERGSLESVMDGKRLVWARTATVPEVVNRRRQETPESRVVRLQPRSGPVAGTGRGERISHPGVAALVSQCLAKGAQVNKLKNNHWEVRHGGRRIAVIPSTPSDGRSLANCRSDIRNGGVLV